MRTDNKSVSPFKEALGKLDADPVCLLRCDFAWAERLAKVVSDHIVFLLPAGNVCIPFFGEKELGVSDTTVALIRRNKPPVICFLRVFDVIYDVTDSPANLSAFAGMKRHYTCCCYAWNTSFR